MNPFSKTLKAKPSEILAVAMKIKNEANWCKRAMAKDSQGNQLYSPFHIAAVQFCILGAVHVVNCESETLEYLNHYIKLMGYNDLARFNDDKSHKEVKNFLKNVYMLSGGSSGEWEKKVGTKN